MKKKIIYQIFSLLIIMFVFAIFGCTAKISDISIKSGSIDTIIVKNSEILTDNFEATVTYSDDTTKIITSKDVVFGDIDTSTTGEKILTITYDNFTKNIKIKVVESTADVVSVSMFNSLIKEDYLNNKKEQVNKQEEFMVLDQPYCVGDDNLFNFRINAKGVDKSGEIQTLDKVRTNIKVELESNGEYTELNNEELNQYVTINTEDTTFDFTESAVGKTFKITVTAVNFDEDYFDNAPYFDMEIKVVDGYNVYNATDLSVLDNSGLYGWNDIKSQELQAISNNINGVLLHDNIRITDEDIPSGLKYNATEAAAISQVVTNQEIVGSIKDSSSYQVYNRLLNNNQEFQFIGNYYQLDFSEVSKIVVQDNKKDGIIVDETEDHKNEKAITVHTSLIRFKPKQGNLTYPKVSVNNISFKGNGKRSNRAIESGGLILIKSEGTKFTANNNIYQDTLIGYFFENFTGDNNNVTAENDQSAYYIINSKGYNCYNSLVYLFGAKDVIIEDSELIGAGGPVMIVDHVDNNENDGTGGYPTNVSIINSKLESFVTGAEPWFATFEGAKSLADSLKTADNLLYGQVPEAVRPTFLVDKDDIEDMMNMLCVAKSSSAEGLTTSIIRSKVTIYESREDYEAQINDGDRSYGLVFGNIIPEKTEYNYFQSNKTGAYAASNGSISANNYFEGNYVNVYVFNGMGCIFELYPAVDE